MADWEVVRETVMPKGENSLGNNYYGYRKLELGLPDGRSATYHGVTPGDCVHVVAVEDDLTTYLVRQKRPNAMQIGSKVVPVTLELPGGFARPTLGLEGSAREEVKEEINRDVESLLEIGKLYTSTGVSNEIDAIYLGTGLSVVERAVHSEATEQDIEIVAEKFGDLMDRIRHNTEPISAQTLAGFALAAPYLG